jgi:hypothetical protein
MFKIDSCIPAQESMLSVFHIDLQAMSTGTASVWRSEPSSGASS